MPNGASVAQKLVPLFTPEPLPQDVGTPTAAPAAPETERRIGEEIARAAVLICLAAEKRLVGQPTKAITRQAGEIFARLYELQATPGIDFVVTATREGRCALRAILMQGPPAAAALCKRGDLDRALDEILAWPLGILARVTEFERRLRH